MLPSIHGFWLGNVFIVAMGTTSSLGQMFYIPGDMLHCGRLQKAVWVNACTLNQGIIILIHPHQVVFLPMVLGQEAINCRFHGLCPSHNIILYDNAFTIH
jgi:hypothetical protein